MSAYERLQDLDGGREMVSKTLFSTGKDDWETPPAFITYLNRTLGLEFIYDLAASKENAITEHYITEADNLLSPHVWPSASGDFWLNPPYSQNSEFIRKAFECSNSIQRTYVLLPARTDTDYWHNYIMKAEVIFCIKGRLKFVGAKSGAPFPTVVVRFASQNINRIPYVISLSPTPKERGF